MILLVDDDALLRSIVFETLEDAGYRVIEAADADEALDVLEGRSDIDLLLTDVRMPGRYDGIALAAMANEKWPKIKILVMSGYAASPEIELPPKAKFLRKPVRVDTLVSSVANLIDSGGDGEGLCP